MTINSEQAIFEALRRLWKGRGATVRDIQREPVLMGLAYVIARAAERTGQTEPTPVDIAAACRRCMRDATEKLPGGDASPLNRENHAVAARLLLGLEVGTQGTKMGYRRGLVARTLGMPEKAIEHMRNYERYDWERLRSVAEIMAHLEANHGGPEFACYAYMAILRLSPSARPEIDRYVLLTALRNEAEQFAFQDISDEDIYKLGAPFHVGARSCTYPNRKVAHSYAPSNNCGSGDAIHLLDISPPLERGQVVGVYFATSYDGLGVPQSAFVRFGPENWGQGVQFLSLKLRVPDSITSAIARVKTDGSSPSEEVWEIHERGAISDAFEFVVRDVKEGYTYELGYENGSAND